MIEDDYANRLFFAEYLMFCGFEVISLTHGLDLAIQLKTFDPHLLLLDIGLPEVDGYSLISLVRTSERWKDLPILVVSGYAFEEDQRRAFALGIQKYLVKPIRLRELSDAVETLLSAP